MLSESERVNPLAPKGSERSGEGFTLGDGDIKCEAEGDELPSRFIQPNLKGEIRLQFHIFDTYIMNLKNKPLNRQKMQFKKIS